ncbi:type IV pilus modification protein PilV [Pseudoxanthomonas sp.]|uniref:type IV pilus modification protein PilV n=1 Tax=Pseudoxanthomonas sp. TaxID=1871049 RepID=UPI0026051BE5|nr:type IV pilus modification protein PilV [Pseudoxanthomonas sp.]WDS37478.1 MAG: type IV pilus modification protein PilV [Pseudoxanthomonas sp.]
MNRPHGMARRASARGEILIEVLIAILILGVGLLGVAAMQATALRNNGSAMQRSQAATQIQTIFDSMRANRTSALAGAYAISRTCTAPSGGTLAGNDLSSWISALQTSLGSAACGTITCSGSPLACTVKVDWDDSHATDASGTGVAAGNATYSISASAQL